MVGRFGTCVCAFPSICAAVMHSFCSREYWDALYLSGDTKGNSEWYSITLSQLRPLLLQYVPLASSSTVGLEEAAKRPTVLHVGCGTSAVSLELALEGYSALCIDYSRPVVDQLVDAWGSVPRLAFKVRRDAKAPGT